MIVTEKISEKSYMISLNSPFEGYFKLFIYSGGPDMTLLGGMRPLHQAHLAIKVKDYEYIDGGRVITIPTMSVVKDRYGGMVVFGSPIIGVRDLVENLNGVLYGHQSVNDFISELYKVLRNFNISRYNHFEFRLPMKKHKLF
jgi:hypothetical protein